MRKPISTWADTLNRLGFKRSKKKRKPRELRPRSLRLEGLDPRVMLSGNAPQVLEVMVGSTSWTQAYRDILEAEGLGDVGYRIPASQQNSQQLAALWWSNINQVSVKFSEDVVVEQEDLNLFRVNAPTYQVASAFAYDDSIHTATWTFSSAIDTNKLRLVLHSSAVDGIRTPAGVALDGEWTNPTSLGGSGAAFPSGDGVAGGNFDFCLNVLPGDLNGSGVVDLGDFGIISFYYGQSSTTQILPADLNGDCTVDLGDFGIFSARYGTSLPTGEPGALDPELISAVRQTLGLPDNASVGPAEFARLTRLTLNSNSVGSLEGLQDATNLQTLEIVPWDHSAPGHLDSIQPLSGLENLKSLVLRGTGLTDADLSTTCALAALESLDLTYNDLTVVPAWVANSLPALKSLKLHGNPLAQRRDLGVIGAGMAAPDTETGPGFILYSEERLQTRLSYPGGYSEHLMPVKYVNNQWCYFTNDAMYQFTPRATDVLVAQVTFGYQATIASLEGIVGVEHGITKGYSSGDLTFVANWHNGAYNEGEFYVGGTYFTLGDNRTALAPLAGKLIDVDLAPDHPERATTIGELAAALYKLPLKMYEYVLGTIEYQPYPGAMKGPLAVLQTKQGNDWDTASLLKQLFAEAGIVLDYATAKIREDKDTVLAWLGAKDVAGAFNLLFYAGLEPELYNASYTRLDPTTQWPQTEHIAFYHAWLHRPSGDGLPEISLDPSWKFKDLQLGIPEVAAYVPFDATREAEYFSAIREDTAYEYYEDELRAYLAEHMPGQTIADVAHDGPIRHQAITALPQAFLFDACLGAIDENEALSYFDDYLHKLRISVNLPQAGNTVSGVVNGQTTTLTATGAVFAQWMADERAPIVLEVAPGDRRVFTIIGYTDSRHVTISGQAAYSGIAFCAPGFTYLDETGDLALKQITIGNTDLGEAPRLYLDGVQTRQSTFAVPSGDQTYLVVLEQTHGNGPVTEIEPARLSTVYQRRAGQYIAVGLDAAQYSQESLVALRNRLNDAQVSKRNGGT
ncbi:MAG: hypothetical protein ACOY3P_26960, partial [Planctomycetota bacterium]